MLLGETVAEESGRAEADNFIYGGTRAKKHSLVGEVPSVYYSCLCFPAELA